jgi:hypothetical protein
MQGFGKDPRFSDQLIQVHRKVDGLRNLGGSYIQYSANGRRSLDGKSKGGGAFCIEEGKRAVLRKVAKMGGICADCARRDFFRESVSTFSAKFRLERHRNKKATL